MTHQTSAAQEAMAAELVASGNYRVLRRSAAAALRRAGCQRHLARRAD